MGLFSKKDRAVGPRVRTGNCVYQGESFPTAGERIAIAGIEVDFLFDQGAIPATWTTLARSIRERTGEPDESRVLTNVLGLLLAMADNTFTTKLGPGLGLASQAAEASAQLRQGVDDIGRYRQLFTSHADGRRAFDFELIKVASLLASQQSAAARRDAGWPHPDLWSGDLGVFKL